MHHSFCITSIPQDVYKRQVDNFWFQFCIQKKLIHIFFRLFHNPVSYTHLVSSDMTISRLRFREERQPPASFRSIWELKQWQEISPSSAASHRVWPTASKARRYLINCFCRRMHVSVRQSWSPIRWVRISLLWELLPWMECWLLWQPTITEEIRCV